MEAIWREWREVKKMCANKKIVLFGRSGDWVHKTVRSLGDIKADYIVDNNSEHTGSVYCDLEVFLPKKLEEEKKSGLLIIITAGPFESVVKELLEKGVSAWS